MAKRIVWGNRVYLAKQCPQHGCFQTLVWDGAPRLDQWQSLRSVLESPVTEQTGDKGCPLDCGLCPAHRQRSCVIILEVTPRCDLGCPVCYADAIPSGEDPPLATIAAWLRRAWQAGGDCNLQLSGGEPTLRDDLPEVVAQGHNQGFGFIQLNTNGRRLSRDQGYLAALQQAGLSSVFLQYDGTEEQIHRVLRGRALLREKNKAIEACGKHGLGVVLVPTLVPGINTHNIGAILHMALTRAPVVRAVHFQPISYFGRCRPPAAQRQRMTLPALMRAIESQTHGLFQVAHFHPPSCENALCSFHARYLRLPDGRLKPMHTDAAATNCCSPLQPDDGARRSIAAVSRQWALAPVTTPVASSQTMVPISPSRGSARMNQDSSATLDLDQFLTRARTHTFTVSAMAFQDAWTITKDRVRECCIHVLAPDGRRIPFCLYNLTSINGTPLYRT